MRVPVLLGVMLLLRACAPTATAHAQATATGPVLHYVPGSTLKLEQLIGDVDKERRQPTLGLTFTRYGVEGTDLGYSFEHEGLAYFLFGDTVGKVGKARDTIATTSALDPELGVRLDFLTGSTGQYLTIDPPGTALARMSEAGPHRAG
jgi:hypothetical protein